MKKDNKIDAIKLDHGAGGKTMSELLDTLIVKQLSSAKNIDVPLSALDDSGVIEDIVLTTDSHVIQPIFFPGGDIGSLAIASTINDLSVMGAQPIALTSAFIIEEGLPMDKVEKIVQSIRTTSDQAGVPIITGDTKVMEKHAIQEFVINTSGIGKYTPVLEQNFTKVQNHRSCTARWLIDSNLQPGDKIIVSGNIGEHGIALLSFREGYDFDTSLTSDVAPLNNLMHEALKTGGIVTAKDPTRGGLANTLNELSEKSKVCIHIQEENIPIPEGVRAGCEMLGLDPLSIGNEGKVVLGVIKEKADGVLHTLQQHPLGKDAAIIGEVTNETQKVILETQVGGKRILRQPTGDPIPRIC